LVASQREAAGVDSEAGGELIGGGEGENGVGRAVDDFDEVGIGAPFGVLGGAGFHFRGGKEELRIEGLFDPEGAVVIEDGDAVG
jgi:hypothetical protein